MSRCTDVDLRIKVQRLCSSLRSVSHLVRASAESWAARYDHAAAAVEGTRLDGELPMRASMDERCCCHFSVYRPLSHG